MHYFFDMDGTLVDSQFAVLESLREAMEENGVVVSQALTTDVIGPQIAQIVRMVCPTVADATLVEIARSFRRRYDSAPERGLRPYEGMEDWLRQLTAEGHTLAVVTNKPLKPTLRILDCLGWRVFFRFVATPDSGPDATTKRRKAESIQALIAENNLHPADVQMVGDTQDDMCAAHEAGVKACAVMWGYEKDKAALRRMADAVMENVP